MTEVPIWFERRLEFSVPVELLLNVCARLRGTPARLEETLRACPNENLTRKDGAKWSAQEHAGHLPDLESLWLKRVDDYANGAAELTPADLTNQTTEQANHNARSLEEIMSEFRAGERKTAYACG